MTDTDQPRKCQRCGDETPDTRTLYMSCLYAMEELKLPFEVRTINREFYTLEVCKDCRADWMMSIKHWFNKKPTYVYSKERLPWTP